MALFFSYVAAIDFLESETRIIEMGIINHCVFHSRVGKRQRKGRIPDALGQPEPLRLESESVFKIVVHHKELTPGIPHRNRGKQRLKKPPGQGFHLPSRDQTCHKLQCAGPVLFKPLQQRT